MKFTTTILFVFLITGTAFGQGTMSTDPETSSEAEASMSGYTEDEIDLRDEEVQLQEDDYDPSIDNEPILIEPDQELLDNYNEKVEQSQP